MKLYEAPEGIKIYADVSDGSEYITFKHIDGVYSLCETGKGGTIHLSASTPLKKYKDGYKIDSNE